MPRPLSRRSTLAFFIAFAATVGVVLTLFAWPGYLVNGCTVLSGPTETIHNRTYCYASVPVPYDSFRCCVTYIEWGFTFELRFVPTPGLAGVELSVHEPGGTAYSGFLDVSGSPRANFTSEWFTPDSEAGATNVWDSGNLTLLVSR